MFFLNTVYLHKTKSLLS